MTESFLDGRVMLHPGDCLDVLAQLEECSIDSCVTDPPYHLTSIVKRFGGNGAAPAQFGTDGAYARASAGFMGKQWDGGDIAFRVETWAAVYRVLKPGAHLLAFSGTRTSHRMVCAIEDAGFEIRDTVMWLYGSGFPKSHDVSKGIDKTRDDSSEIEHVRRWLELERQRAGITRKAVNAALGLADNGGGLMSSWTTNKTTACIPQWEQWLQLKSLLGFGDEIDAEVWRLNGRKGTPGEAWNDRKFYDEPTGGLHGGSGNTVGAWKLGRQAKPGGATDAAREWEGWGTALKPACEPIVLARKPLSEPTVAANVLRWGTGAINVDGCRISTDEAITPFGSPKRSVGGIMNGTEAAREQFQQSNFGRWPANVIHDGSEEVVGAFPETDISSGRRVAASKNCFGMKAQPEIQTGYGDKGSGARFFYQVQSDVRCELCDVNIAGNPSRTESTPTDASVRSDVAASPPLANADIEPRSNNPASNAAGHSRRCHPPKAGTVQNSVQTWDERKIAQNVSDAADLCGSCATDIARALVEVRRQGIAVPVHLSRCTGSSAEKILSRSLASYVVHRESTDTILTTANLSELFGCVFHAIAESTNSERAGNEANTRPAPKRLFYSSKADADDRLGSKHPTVKPLDLMQYLVRLVTPPHGLVLDPFAGTGTTGEAAWREGMRAVLIERETEYQADIRRRMALVLAGPDERVRESVKARGKPVDYGPLFDTYNATDDFAKSIDLAYETIRERKANGGPGWVQKVK